MVIPRPQQEFANTYFGVGEAFPVLQPVAGRIGIIPAAYLGCPLEFLNRDAVWTHPVIKDWRTRPRFDFNPNNLLWQKSQRLLQTAAGQADGYFVGIPALNGPIEILARLHDTQTLALDFYDHTETIKPALSEINLTGNRYRQECVAITHPTVRYLYWMGLWSEVPTTDLHSGFSCLISSRVFDEYFLPFLAEQTDWIPRTIYHLDGKGAIRHLESLFVLPRLGDSNGCPEPGRSPLWSGYHCCNASSRLCETGLCLLHAKPCGEVAE